jgi:hypothetical protein
VIFARIVPLLIVVGIPRAGVRPFQGREEVRWSTPLAGYRSFGPVRLASGGEARWHEPGGDYAYIELTLDDVQYNVRSR